MLILRRLALLLWLASLALPTATGHDGRLLFGYEFLAGALAASLFVPFSLAYPVQLASVWSNYLVLREGVRQLQRKESTGSVPYALVLLLACLVNANVAFMKVNNVPLHPGLLSLPGYYVWLSSFFLLAFCSVCECKQFFLRVGVRTAALLAVIAATSWLGVLAIVALGGGK